ncbi:hypothetical protein Tco_0503755, partial [Tanacetum coccineum]
EDAIISPRDRVYRLLPRDPVNRPTPSKLLMKQLRAISGHMLGAAGVQIPENNLDNLHSPREEDGISETIDPQDLLGSFLLAEIDLVFLGLLTRSVVLDFLGFLE